jgi:small GTP-binding protein
LSPLFYCDAEAAAVVFDLADSVPFARASEWSDELKRERGDDIMIVLVGNKCDLESQRTVGRHDAEQSAASIGAPYFETSAKTNVNIKSTFDAICDGIAHKLTALVEADPPRTLRNTVAMPESEKKPSGCC